MRYRVVLPGAANEVFSSNDDFVVAQVPAGRR